MPTSVKKQKIEISNLGTYLSVLYCTCAILIWIYLCSRLDFAVLIRYNTLYQERAVFGKMKMDPGKRAQTQNTSEVSSLKWSFPNSLN